MCEFSINFEFTVSFRSDCNAFVFVHQCLHEYPLSIHECKSFLIFQDIYLYQVQEVTDIDIGIIRPECRQGQIEYTVQFMATICVITNGDEIITQVDKLNMIAIASINGPILAITPLNKIDLEKFKVQDGIITDMGGKTLHEGMKIKIQVLAHCMHPNSDKIQVFANLLEISPEESQDESLIIPTNQDLEQEIRLDNVNRHYSIDIGEEEEEGMMMD